MTLPIKCFEKAYQKRAKPLEKLQQRHRQFQRRFAKHVLQQQQDKKKKSIVMMVVVEGLLQD